MYQSLSPLQHSKSSFWLPTAESTGRETPSHKNGGQSAFTEVTGGSMTVGLTDREASKVVLPVPVFYWTLQGGLQRALHHIKQYYNAMLYNCQLKPERS